MPFKVIQGHRCRY